MRIVTTCIVIAMGFNSLAQNTSTRNWIYSEGEYSDTNGHTLRVVNSLPKGGGTYTNSNGDTYSYVNFWYRLTNASEDPMDLILEFPAQPYAIFPSAESHLRIFLPPETMTSEKIEQFDYGLTGLRGFLDAGFYESSRIEKTIDPQGEYLFYISVLIYQAEGTARAALVFEDDDVFYQIKMNKNDASIPCGRITFKN